MLISKEIQEIENISENLEKSLSTDEYQAYDLLTQLENIRISIDWIKEVVSNRIKISKERLTPVFTNHFSELLKEFNWPFRTKGEIISLKPETLSKFKNLSAKLLHLKDVEYLSEILTQKIITQLKFHFLSEKSTNRIDKPEWMLSFSINSIKLNICEFLDSLALKNLDTILDHCTQEILNTVAQRVFYDAKTAIESSKENLFLHIIDEVLKFDVSLNEMKSKDFLLKKIMTPEVLFVWIGYENSYIVVEIEKIMSKKSWEVENIIGMKYDHINEIILLHNSLMIKYNDIFAVEIRDKLIENMNKNIAKLFLDVYNERFDIDKASIMHYESNHDLWCKICTKLAALYQGLILFQQFLLNINKDAFAESHLSINLLKKNIVDKILAFVMYTIDEILSDYIEKAQWKEKDRLRIRTIKRLIKDFKKSTTQELSKLILSFVYQKIREIIASGVKGKKIKNEYQENAVQDFKNLFGLFNDKCESFLASVFEKL